MGLNLPLEIFLFFLCALAPLMRSIHGAPPAGALKCVQFRSGRNCALGFFRPQKKRRVAPALSGETYCYGLVLVGRDTHGVLQELAGARGGDGIHQSDDGVQFTSTC
jgi:hypothetical protein